MKTILAATDFSATADNALHYAADLAIACNAHLTLLHVVQIPDLFLSVPLTAFSVDDMEHDAGIELNKVKDALVQKKGTGLVVDVKVRIGTFLDELKTICEDMQPHYVVIGSQGTTSAEHLVFGNHAVSAMKYLLWPLISVPLHAVYASVKKIGVACDFKNVVDLMPVEEIKSFADDFHALLYVINTGKVNQFNPQIIFGCRLLNEKLKPVKPIYRFITNADITTGILEVVNQDHIDLLIVIPKQHSLLDALIHSSETKKLVLHSPVPVMALHQ